MRGSGHIGKTRIRYRLSVQEDPPNGWYVCVLCGKRFVSDDHYCIVVVIPPEHRYDEDQRFYIPVHTPCVSKGVGDPSVLAMVRRYTHEIKEKLERAALARAEAR